MNVNVLHVPAFADNYIWLITGDDENFPAGARRPCIIVDPGDGDAAMAGASRHQLEPVAIFCTHHHGDHVGGVRDILEHHDIPVYGPARESIRTITHPVEGGETIEIEGVGAFTVLATPGHTTGHVSFLGGGALFCGDTLFSGGCGRLLGGTAPQLFKSLKQLAGLAPDTRVFCAHEYTLSNLSFAGAADPENPEIAKYRQRCQAMREKNQPTLPSTIALELDINPFLRTGTTGVRNQVQATVGHGLDSELEVFTALRRWKDNFAG